jgi:hypothetical protein
VALRNTGGNRGAAAQADGSRSFVSRLEGKESDARRSLAASVLKPDGILTSGGVYSEARQELPHNLSGRPDPWVGMFRQNDATPHRFCAMLRAKSETSHLSSGVVR